MNEMASLEALLFLHGDPMPIEALASTLNISKQKITSLLTKLEKAYEDNTDRGLRLLLHDNTAQLITHPRTSSAVEAFHESSVREALTPAALETLAVIAYRGPIPKSEIESVRGVNCSAILQTLLLRGLVQRERHDEDRRTFLYHVSGDFLKALGIASIEDLPDFETFRHA